LPESGCRTPMGTALAGENCPLAAWNQTCTFVISVLVTALPRLLTAMLLKVSVPVRVTERPMTGLSMEPAARLRAPWLNRVTLATCAQAAGGSKRSDRHKIGFSRYKKLFIQMSFRTQIGRNKFKNINPAEICAFKWSEG